MAAQAAPTLQTRTFLLTDIEGSTRLWADDAAAMRVALARHDELLRAAIETAGGTVFKTIGDAFCAAFPTAEAALVAAASAQRALVSALPPSPGPVIRVRMALHTGDAQLRDEDFFGPAMNHAARLRDALHGGQIALSEATETLLREGVLPQGVTLRDLGKHRLRDLSSSEHVWQAEHGDLPGEFPPLRTLDTLPNNLPHQLNSFVGRERESAAVRAHFSPESKRRLVTLTGAGGSGKTRLALQVGASLLPAFEHGVYFVDLAPLSSPDLIPGAFAAALRVREAEGRALRDDLVQHLLTRSVLLIADNCEHLIDGCASFCEGLLRQCPRVRILATSRERLGVLAEQVEPIAPLGIPQLSGGNAAPSVPEAPAESLLDYPAVRLFQERAQAVSPAFAVTDENAAAVADICRRLDGIPLAIELAAPWVASLTPDKLLQRLSQIIDRARGPRTAEDRHRTLTETIAWSYRLLSEPQRVLLRRLSVFAGGWTLEAAEQVCADEDALPDFEVFIALTDLVQKSLVVYEEKPTGPRYRLLETVREFATKALSEAGETDDLLARHQAFFLRAAEEAEPNLRGSDQKAWLDRLEQEHDNLRTAMHSRVPHDESAALRIAGAISWFWFIRGHFSEGKEWLARTLAHGESNPGVYWAKAAANFGILAMTQGDNESATEWLIKAQSVYSECHSTTQLASVQANLGILASKRGDYDTAETHLSQSLSIFRGQGEDARISQILRNLASVTILKREYDKARHYLAESLQISRRLCDDRGIAVCLHNSGELERLQGALAPASRSLYESIQLYAALQSDEGLAGALHSLALTYYQAGESDKAAYLFGAAEAARLRAQIEWSHQQRADRESSQAGIGQKEHAHLFAKGENAAVSDVLQTLASQQSVLVLSVS